MKQTPGKEPGEDLDVRKVHGQIWRELPEPWEQESRVPPWLKHLIYAPLAIWAIWYLIYQSGGFRWDNMVEGIAANQLMNLAGVESVEADSDEDVAAPAGVTIVTDAVAEPPLGTADSSAAIEAGRTIYAQACAACHQPNGQGLAAVFPPLAASDWVSGDERRLALLVLHGLMGPIEVNGQPWNGVMPGQGQMLTDQQIADVLTHVRASWGNQSAPVNASTVAGLRRQYEGHQPWTSESLDAALTSP